ncbi:hypothetical protein QUF63_11700, partial [Anaerolineales bacterium HSG25]|nr:hypothetical protein [Anaerolineales bacterium HSG25]
KLDNAIIEHEEARKVAYITSIERQGIEKGIKQGIEQGIEQGIQKGELQIAREDVIEVLMIRFGKLPKKLVKSIKQIDELTLLKTLLKKAVVVESLAKFKRLVADLLTDKPAKPNRIASHDD